MRTDAHYPPTIHDWFEAELDKKLASLSSDQARYRELILQNNVWSGHAVAYASDGSQPFDGPHPHYGRMGAADFTNLLCLIASRRSELEKARPSATSLTELIGSAAAMITAVGAWVAWYVVLCPPAVL